MEGRRISFSFLFSCEGNIRLDLKIGFPTLSNKSNSCKSCVQRDPRAVKVQKGRVQRCGKRTSQKGISALTGGIVDQKII